jgi:CBS domain-containing protein
MLSKIRDIVSVNGGRLHSVTSPTPVFDAVGLMDKHDIGALLVIDGGQLSGIFTERDVVRRVARPGRDLRLTTVASVMTMAPTCVDPDFSAQEALRIMNARKFRHLPVMEGTRPVGIVSLRDLTDWALNAREQQIAALIGVVKAGAVRR